MDFGRGGMDQVAIRIEGAEQSSLIEAHVRLKSLIRSESIEENALDERVDRQCPDFLAQCAGSFVAIDPATIDWVVAIRPLVAQAHAPAAAATDCDALQQRRAGVPASYERSGGLDGSVAGIYAATVRHTTEPHQS
jgi:hypothetical protein